jgi:hypothetical protein
MSGIARRGTGVVLCIAGLSACGGDSTAPLAACEGAVTLGATRGTIPIIRWSPACLAGALLVEPLPPSQGFGWHWVVTAESQLIAPGVRYGELPEGTTESHAAWPLAPDDPYTVYLLDAHGAEIGRREFSP